MDSVLLIAIGVGLLAFASRTDASDGRPTLDLSKPTSKPISRPKPKPAPEPTEDTEATLGVPATGRNIPIRRTWYSRTLSGDERQRRIGAFGVVVHLRANSFERPRADLEEIRDQSVLLGADYARRFAKMMPQLSDQQPDGVEVRETPRDLMVMITWNMVAMGDQYRDRAKLDVPTLAWLKKNDDFGDRVVSMFSAVLMTTDPNEVPEPVED